jgi:hypothetical protein
MSEIKEVKFKPSISLLPKTVPRPGPISKFHMSTCPLTILRGVLTFKINKETFAK